LVRLLEQKQALVECFAPRGGECTIIGCGRPKARLRSAEAAFLTDLNGSTLAEYPAATGRDSRVNLGSDQCNPARFYETEISFISLSKASTISRAGSARARAACAPAHCAA
jgi:hypothetical protein